MLEGLKILFPGTDDSRLEEVAGLSWVLERHGVVGRNQVCGFWTIAGDESNGFNQTEENLSMSAADLLRRYPSVFDVESAKSCAWDQSATMRAVGYDAPPPGFIPVRNLESQEEVPVVSTDAVLGALEMSVWWFVRSGANDYPYVAEQQSRLGLGDYRLDERRSLFARAKEVL